jgi:hypothetical protein
MPKKARVFAREIPVLSWVVARELESGSAQVKLEAFPFTRYGTVPGKIKVVSEDSVSGSAEQQDGMSSDAESAKGHFSNPIRRTRETRSCDDDSRRQGYKVNGGNGGNGGDQKLESED